MILWLPIAIPLALLLRWQPGSPIAPSQKLPLVASLYAVAPIVLWGAAVVTRHTFADYGLVWNALLQGLGSGLLLGAGGLVVLFTIEHQVGWLHWQAKSLPFASLAAMLAIGLWVGFTEEWIFRGFLQTQLQENYPVWLAAAIGSLIFALLHLVWEGKETLPQLPGLWLMGMVLVLARLKTGDLWLAWGLHAGWVWVISTIDSLQAITYTEAAPRWMTGIYNKPLAGVIGLLFLLLTGAILWLIPFLL